MDLTVLTDQSHQHYQKVPMAHWDHSDQKGHLDQKALSYLHLWGLMDRWVQMDP